MADGIHQRLVGHDEEYRGIFGRILVAVKIPERHDEGIALFPFVALVADGADAAAAPYVINGRAGVTMALGLFPPRSIWIWQAIVGRVGAAVNGLA